MSSVIKSLYFMAFFMGLIFFPSASHLQCLSGGLDKEDPCSSLHKSLRGVWFMAYQ